MNKTTIKVWTAVAIIALVYCAAFFTGCATKPGDSGGIPAPNCAELSKIVELYDAAVAAGTHIPSKEEERAALAARTLIAIYCSAKGTGHHQGV